MFCSNYLTIWNLRLKQDFLDAVVSEKTEVKPKKPSYVRNLKGNPQCMFEAYVPSIHICNIYTILQYPTLILSCSLCSLANKQISSFSICYPCIMFHLLRSLAKYGSIKLRRNLQAIVQKVSVVACSAASASCQLAVLFLSPRPLYILSFKFSLLELSIS